MHYDSESMLQWRRDRLLCSPQNFPTYFRLMPGDDAASGELMRELVVGAGKTDRVREILMQSVAVPRRSGRTQASLLLDELAAHTQDVTDVDVPKLLQVLFEFGDVLHTSADGRRAFGSTDDQLRLHWLLNRLVRERFPLEQRAAIVLEAARSAALGWLSDIATRCCREHEPDQQGRLVAPEDRLTNLP
jgi:hypothetical protein